MNIEIANRLVKLRKEKGLSQEELADKLGLSRQAVSKWERAEASPDTDNLICLAKLYGVSLDQLLKTQDDAETIVDEQVKKDEAPKEEEQESSEEEENDKDDRDGNGKREHVHIGLNGIHVVDKDGEVHIDLHGIHVHDKDNDVDIDGDGIKNCNCHIDDDGHRWKDHKGSKIGGIISGVYALLSVVAYILLGSFIPGAWGYAWILFLLIPVIGSIPSAIRHRSFSVFCYPLLATAAYFFLCMVLPSFGVLPAMWHPLWVIFLTIPIYYMIFGPIDASMRRHRCRKNIYFSKGDVIENDDDDEDDDDDEEDEK